MWPFESSRAFNVRNHPGEDDDHAKSSCNVHCTRTGLPVICERMAASPSAPSPPNVVRPNCACMFEPADNYFFLRQLNVFAICARNPCEFAEWVHSCCPIHPYISDRNKRPDWCMLHIGLLIGRRDYFGCACHSGSDIGCITPLAGFPHAYRVTSA